jgi:2-C-methyl-D-erythritol 4-phosphate cytidylyltransferase
MYQNHRIGAIILMAGSGSRFGTKTPKQFLLLGQKRVYLHTVDVFTETNVFDEIVLVCPQDWQEVVMQEVPRATVILGGKTRQESSYLGLLGFSQKPDIVVIHDAVRPFVSRDILDSNIHQAILHGAVDTCIASSDTLVYAPGGKTIANIPKREDYLRGQTPQTFRFDWIWQAHQEAATQDAHDDCQLLLKIGRSVHIVPGNDTNFKITTEVDLILAERIIQNKNTINV